MKARRGHAFGGGVVLKGKPEGIGRSLGRTEGGGGKMSVSEFEKRLGGGSAEEEGQRSRALSCRPGRQIRRGLKRGVDCV